jgi:TM2 domain-containing membrane protein YozV
MDSFQELIKLILNITLCVCPIIILVIAVLAFFLYIRYRKLNRLEKLKKSLHSMPNDSLLGIDYVLERGGNENIPLTKQLVFGAQLFDKLSKKDIAPLENKSFNTFTQNLVAYKQRASYGIFPKEDLNNLRRDDLNRVDNLANKIKLLVQAAENGEANLVRDYLLDIDKIYKDVYDKHVAFLEILSENGIKYPIPKPVPISNPTPQNVELVSSQIIQRLPEDKQMLFMMQYNNESKNPTTAVLLAVFLGGLGAHKFYMGQIGLGIIYLLFSWTWLPMIIALIEAFGLSNQVRRYNAQKAVEIAYRLGLRY